MKDQLVNRVRITAFNFFQLREVGFFKYNIRAAVIPNLDIIVVTHDLADKRETRVAGELIQ